MIEITKDEAAYIRSKVRNASIRRTVNRFYLEESRPAMRALSRYRERSIIEEHGRFGKLVKP